LANKFLVIGDVHFRGVNPRARLDNFQEAILRKLHEVFTLAQKHSVAAIVCPGDLLDSPATGWSTVADLAEILQSAPCPFLTINGNHDIYAGNSGSKYRTPFGFLARLGIIQDLGEEPFESGDMLNVAVTGHGFNIETDTELGKEQFNPPQHIETEAWAGASIHVVHSMLMDHSPGFDMRHTLISQVETTANVIVCGHLHTGFGSSYVRRRDDGVLFINPGALCRLSAHAAEIERPVQVALLTVHEGKEIEAELIPLQCAAPGHEVLSRAHLEAEAERNDRLEKFLGLLASEGESKFLEVREIVEDIAAREQLPEKVKREALKRIGEARERLGVGVS
jgi:exonuclease SbcD